MSADSETAPGGVPPAPGQTGSQQPAPHPGYGQQPPSPPPGFGEQAPAPPPGFGGPPYGSPPAPTPGYGQPPYGSVPSTPPEFPSAPYGGMPNVAPTWMVVVGWLTAVFLPLIGIIIGYQLTRKYPSQKGMGQAMMGVGVVFIFINFAIYTG